MPDSIKAIAITLIAACGSSPALVPDASELDAITVDAIDATPDRELSLIFGQSNAADMGDVTEIDPMYAQPFPVTYDYHLILGTNAIVVENSGMLAPRPINHFGIELSLGRTVPDRGIVKYARGGTSLAVDWASGSELRTGAYAFAHSIETLRGARVTSLLFLQGEHDATVLEQATAYGDNLVQLIDESRAEFPGAQFYLYKLPIAEPYAALVRSGETTAAATTGAIMIDVDDLPRNGVHFTSAGYVTLGERFGHEIAR